METDISFELKRDEKMKKNVNFNLFTIFYDKEVFDNIIERNLKLNRLGLIHIFVEKGFPENLNEKYQTDKICLIETVYEDINEITYNYIFDFIFKHFQNETCVVIRPDIFLINNKGYEFIDIYLDKNNFLCLSSIFCDEKDQMSKNNILMRTFYSMAQDCWIFKTKEGVDFSEMDCDIKFNIRRNETKFNYFLAKYFDLINDTDTFKVLCRIHPDIGNLRLDEPEFTKEKTLLLPETPIMDKMSLDNLVKYLGLTDKELYKLKCSIITRFNNFN